MTGPSFFDTNILVYALADTTNQKSSVALDVIAGADAAFISSQVLSEFGSVVLRKYGYTEQQLNDAFQQIEKYSSVVPVDFLVAKMASEIRVVYKLSYWDSLIVGCAISSGSRTLFTEDLHHGLEVWGSLQIINPFK
jgi:predicted nucleic acid-binding protein